jgi:hypothetical protein
VVAKRSIPADVQRRFVEAYGNAGIVELVVLCGLYAIMGYMTTAFDIGIEKGLPHSAVFRQQLAGKKAHRGSKPGGPYLLRCAGQSSSTRLCRPRHSCTGHGSYTENRGLRMPK